MLSMDSLETVGKPETAASGVEPPAMEALRQLEQIELDLREQVLRAAGGGESFDSTEWMLWNLVKQIGYAAMELLLRLQGNGDLGEQITTGDARKLDRSDEPVVTKVRSIFGDHRFEQFTYSPGVNKRIELRPISTRLQLPANRWSYLLQEFSQIFCVDQAFEQSASSLERVFGRKFSIDTLEQTTARIGQQADAFLDALPKPTPQTESEILVASADCKGIPLIKENSEPVAAFQTTRKRPGNRRMATVSSVLRLLDISEQRKKS